MVCFESLFDTNYSNLHELKYQKLRVKKEFALGIAAKMRQWSHTSSNEFFSNVLEIAVESPTRQNDRGKKAFLSGERPKKDFLHCFKHVIFPLRKPTNFKLLNDLIVDEFEKIGQNFFFLKSTFIVS